MNAVGDAVERALKKVSGERGVFIVGYYLFKNHRMTFDDVLYAPGTFTAVLSEVYGGYAGIVERVICEEIAHDLNVQYSGESLDALSKKVMSMKGS